MEEMIYLDRSATTPLSDAVKQNIIETMDRFGNPSSLHNLGVDGEHIVTDAKKALLSALGMQNAKTSELIFTGGGSEANKLALAGVARAKAQNKGGRIITTAAEHPSVLECAVTAVPDPIRGQVVKATIVLAKGWKDKAGDELKKELQNHVKVTTAPYKYPRVVEFVDELPKITSGKIRRVEIRQNDANK